MKKNFFKNMLIGLLAASMLVSCGTGGAGDGQDGQKGAEGTLTEMEIGPVENLFGPNFSIEVLEQGVKKVIDGDGREMYLVAKALEEVPAAYADKMVIRTPVDNAVFLSSTQVCTFRAVDDMSIVDHIGGVTGGADAWNDVPAVKKALEEGKITDVSGSGGMGEPNYELIASLEPEIVFVYTGDWPQSNEIAKLQELGIPYAVDNEYMEKNYLARMEWMRFLLTFFDADMEVDNVLTAAKKTVDDVKAAIAGKENPTLAVFSVYNGAISATSPDSWLGSMIKDLGAVNVFADVPEGALTTEAGFECMADADVIVYASTPSWCPGMSGVTEAFPQIVDCQAYADGQVYQYSDLFWNGIDQSDIMAADLAAALYPDVFPDRAQTYFIKLDK